MISDMALACSSLMHELSLISKYCELDFVNNRLWRVMTNQQAPSVRVDYCRTCDIILKLNINTCAMLLEYFITM